MGIQKQHGWPIILMGCVWLGVVWMWEWAYLTLPVDDSFYYIQTARNLAQGYGSTFDRLNPTNGYHPLWLILLTCLQPYLPESTATSVRMILTCQLGLVGLALFGLYRLQILVGIRSAVGVVLLFGCFYTTKILVNALESALLLTGMVVLLCCWYGLENRSTRHWGRWRSGVVAGVVAGLVVWARLESMAFVLLVFSMPWIWPNTRNVGTTCHKKPWIGAWSVCILMVASYLLWNWMQYAHWLPVSGAIKLQQRPWLSGWVRVASVPVFFSCFILPWWWGRYVVDNERIRMLVRLGYPVWGYAVAIFGYQILVLGQPLPPLWYAVPHLLVVIIILEIVYTLAEASPIVVRVLWGLGIGWLGFLAVTWWYRIQPDSYRLYVERRNVGLWLRKHHPNDIVAGWDCGMAAAHFQGKWINLDGLINSWHYKTQYLDRNKTQEFIDRIHRVNWLVQHIPLHVLPIVRQWRGVDLTSWYVKKATCLQGRVIRKPKVPVVWVQLLLSRSDTGLSFSSWAKQAHSQCRVLRSHLRAISR